LIPEAITCALAQAIHQSITGATVDVYVNTQIIVDDSFKPGIIGGYNAIMYVLTNWSTEDLDTIFQIIITTYKIPLELGAHFYFKFADKHTPFRERMMTSSPFLREFYVQSKKRIHTHDISDNF